MKERRHFFDAILDSPISLAKRVFKAHPKQVADWTMFASIDKNIVVVEHSVMLATFSFEGWRMALLFEDWEGASKEELTNFETLCRRSKWGFDSAPEELRVRTLRENIYGNTSQ